MKEYKGKIKLVGNEYDVKVVDGERLVWVNKKWLTVDEFFKTLPIEIIKNLAFVGKIALQDEKLGRPKEKGKYQYLANLEF